MWRMRCQKSQGSGQRGEQNPHKVLPPCKHLSLITKTFQQNYFSPIKCQAISKNNQLPSGALTVLVRCAFAHGVLGVRLQVPYCTKATVSAKGPSHGNPAVDWSHSPAPGSPSRGSPQPMAWEMLENYGKIGDRITQL